tara:strand:- start:208 stop:405 length:198 start_codon:yes stop_codon:yes gene_type:complete
MKVWIVTSGEMCEGQSPVSVHVDHDDAVKAALALTPCFDPWTPEGEDRWVSGCDVLAVVEFEVNE